MPESLTAPVAPGITGAPVTPVVPVAPVAANDAASPSLADQLYSTPPVTSPVAVADPAAPAGDTEPTDTPATETGDAPEYIQGDDGRWRRADGTFATTEELTQIEAQLAEADKAKADADAARAPTVAKVRDRNGNIVEVETGDEQLAQLINQNTNDGMRRREFEERSAALEAREAEFNEFQTMLSQNPESIWNELPPQTQVRLLARGLAQHFDDLVDVINDYNQNPGKRIAAVAQMQADARQQEGRVQAALSSRQQAAEVKKAVGALIPETVPEETVREFWDFASMHLTRLLDQGLTVTKDSVKGQLAGLMARFGFEDVGAAPAAPARPRISLAKPAASTPAKPAAPAAGAPSDSGPANANQRFRLVQQRRNAAAIPPHGRGGPAKPAASPSDRAFTDAAHLLYGNTPRQR